jgi:hypothetical protein
VSCEVINILTLKSPPKIDVPIPKESDPMEESDQIFRLWPSGI